MSRCTLCGAILAEIAEPFFEKEGYRLARCGSCGLVFVANPPTADELRRFSFDEGYGLESRDDPAEIARLQALGRRHLAALNEAVARRGRLLDVGCSAGFFLAAARDAGWEVQGVELNADAAELARARLGLDVVIGDLAGAGFPRASFDAVTFWDVLEHLRDPAETLRTARALLRPGGTLALSNAEHRRALPTGSRGSSGAAPATGPIRSRPRICSSSPSGR